MRSCLTTFIAVLGIACAFSADKAKWISGEAYGRTNAAAPIL